MKKHLIFGLIILILVGLNITQFFIYNHNSLFTDMVPDEETALKIAEIVLVAVYGEDVLLSKPFNIYYSNKMWIVEGNLPDGYAGGVPSVVIRMRDGKIMKIGHSM